MTSRYNRHIILSEIGTEGQDKISNAKILVIGAGGLGCPLLQYLTAAGVGTIGIMDFDVVELSNLQRQILFGTSSLGKNKAFAAKARLEDLNDRISIIAYPKRLTYQNAIDIFNQYDIIVDGSDNFETRYLVNDACIITNKPLVFGAIYKFEGQVSVFNYKNGPSYRCLFPYPPRKAAVPNCSEIGVLGVLPGIIGCMQANEVLKIILNIGEVLSGKLWCFNALTSQTAILKVKRNENVIQSILKEKAIFSKKQASMGCEPEIFEVSIQDILSDGNVQFIDVRESDEQPKVKDFEVICIPIGELKNNLNKIDISKHKAVFCQSGARSKQAVLILKAFGFENCFCIKEGATDIIETYGVFKTLQVHNKRKSI